MKNTVLKLPLRMSLWPQLSIYFLCHASLLWVQAAPRHRSSNNLPHQSWEMTLWTTQRHSGSFQIQNEIFHREKRGKKKKKKRHRFDDLISVLYLFTGWWEQQASGCVCTSSYHPPPGTAKHPLPTSPGGVRGHHRIANRFAKCTGVRPWIIRTKTICTGHSRYGWARREQLLGKGTLLFR